MLLQETPMAIENAPDVIIIAAHCIECGHVGKGIGWIHEPDSALAMYPARMPASAIRQYISCRECRGQMQLELEAVPDA